MLSPRFGQAAVVFVCCATLTCRETSTQAPPPTPASIRVVSGSGQSDTIGATLPKPIAVRVLAQNGSGIPNVAVYFEVSQGTIAQLATTDATGVVQVIWTLGSLNGADSLWATIPALPGQAAVAFATTVPGHLASIALHPDTLRFDRLGDSTRIAARGLDRVGDSVAVASVTWASSDSAIATVTANGTVRARASGSAIVTVRADSAAVVGSASVSVIQVAKTVTVSPKTDTLNWLGEKERLAATVLDSGGYVIPRAPVSWQSGTAAVTVDSSGVVKAVEVGTGMVVVASGAAADTAMVTVRQIAATVSIAPPVDTLHAIADTTLFVASVRDTGGSIVQAGLIVWTSVDTGIATVSAGGVGKARANGTTRILAVAGAAKDSAILSVRQRVAHIAVSPDSLALPIGSHSQASVTATDSNGYLVDTTVAPILGQWHTSNINWASVDQTGGVTARSSGDVAITFATATASDTMAVAIPAPPATPVKAWIWQSPHPQGDALLAVSGDSANDVYAAGQYGTIVHFDGATWSAEPRLIAGQFDALWVSPAGIAYLGGGDLSGNPAPIVRGSAGNWTVDTIQAGLIRALWGVTDTSVYAGEDNGTIWKYNGAQWTTLSSAPLSELMQLTGTVAGDVIAGGSVSGNTIGAVARYSSGVWNTLYEGYGQVTGLWRAPDSVLFVTARTGACNSAVLRLAGTTWDTLLTVPVMLTTISGRSSSDVGVQGSCGSTVERWHWDGASWASQTDAAPTFAGPIWASPDGTWITVGSDGLIERGSGLNWPLITTGLIGQTYMILVGYAPAEPWMWGAGQVYLPTWDSRLLEWDGSQLKEIVTPISGVQSPVTGMNRELWAVWGSAPSNLFLGGGSTVGDGVLLHFVNGSWTTVFDNSSIIIHAIWGSDSNSVFALGNGGGWHFDGSSWTRTGVGVLDNAGITAVWGSSDHDVWACAGTDVYHFNGATWAAPVGSPVACGAIFGFSSNDIYIVGPANGTSTTSNGVAHYDGSSWTLQYSGLPVEGDYSVWGSGPADVYAYFGNEFLRYDGSSWSPLALPPFPGVLLGDGLGSVLLVGGAASIASGQ